MIPLLLRDLESLFGWLLAASWQTSVLALLVLGLQGALRGRLNPRWRYALWLLVLLRLVLPALPESALSLFQFTPPPPVAIVVPMTEPLFVQTSLPSPQVDVFIPKPSCPFSFYSLLAVTWLAGAAILLVLTWQVNRRFARQIGNSPEITDSGLLKLFTATKAELGVHRPIRLIENGQVQSPAIMGLFQPMLLLPADVRAKFDPTELRLIFLHELAHLKRGDVIVQALIALLQILHWFNPVLWYAFRRMRIDREPATDALVLSRAGEDEKERYGLMLIKLLEHFNQRHSLPTLVGILEDKDQFKHRFSLIARFTRGAYGWSLLGVVIIGVLAVACLTKSKATEPTATSPIQPSAEVLGKIPAGFARVSAKDAQIEVGFKLTEITEDAYQANKTAIDSAVDKDGVALVTLLNNLKGVSLLSAPSVTTKPGLKATIEIVRKFSYPVSFDNALYVSQENGGPNLSVPPTPREFVTKDVGISTEITPSIDNGNSPNHGKIILNGKFNVTDFAGFTKSNLTGVGMPSFNTSETLFFEALDDKQLKAIWIPGMQYDEQTVTEILAGKKVSSTNIEKKRRLIIVSARLIK